MTTPKEPGAQAREAAKRCAVEKLTKFPRANWEPASAIESGFLSGATWEYCLNRAELESLRTALIQVTKALKDAEYDLSRIETADWDIHQARLCAGAAANRAGKALNPECGK